MRGGCKDVIGCSYIDALAACAVLLSFPLLFLLLQLFDALLQYIGPKVTLEVRQLFGTCQTIFCCLLENILWGCMKDEVSMFLRE